MSLDRVKRENGLFLPTRISLEKGTLMTTTKKVAAKKTAPKPAPKKSSKAGADNYTNPALREKIKADITAGDKGGRAGQWSARKAQLVAHEYEAQGGGYKHERTDEQKSLKTWGDEHWHTEDGKQAVQGETTHRYLPDAAWKELSPEERKATDQKKVAGSKRGEQFVANTAPAAKARKGVTAGKAAVKKAAGKAESKSAAAKAAPRNRTAAKPAPTSAAK